MSPALPRSVHPVAWWGWAIGLAVAVSGVTNPFLLLTALGVTALVVMSRRGSSPWARSFRLYLWLGALIVTIRAFLHVLVGLKFGEPVLLPLPEVSLPSWAAGINLLGDVRLGGLVAALTEGLRLAVMIVCIGAANSLANPKRLLRSLPGALSEIGSAVVVTITVAPQLADSVQRVMRARALRGDTGRGIRALPRVALPVLEDTLDRSLMLAAAMDSRGYGRRRELARVHARSDGRVHARRTARQRGRHLRRPRRHHPGLAGWTGPPRRGGALVHRDLARRARQLPLHLPSGPVALAGDAHRRVRGRGRDRCPDRHAG